MKELDMTKAKEVITRKLPKEKIKQRQGSFGMTLDYIEGATVIELLNEAFDYAWSFEIVGSEKVQAEKKYNKYKKKYEDQPPYMKVHGRLTIPQLNIVKEQFGTKIYLGGSTEQEGAAKSAATDALKKCATLLGIGLELYKDDVEIAEKAKETKVESQNNNYSNNNYNTKKYTGAKASSAKVSTKTTKAKANTEYDPKEVNKLKELKAILGIEASDNSGLNPFVVEFTGDKNADFRYVTPDNIQAFNKFLEKKTEGI
jgi:recombination DNA repair RAD52 pathway protein